MSDLLFPANSSGAFRVARVGALLLIGALLLAWLIGAILWWQGMITDLDRILSATFFNGWQAADIRAASAEAGLPPIVFPIFWFFLELVTLTGFGAMSLLLYMRKPDWFGTYLAVAFMFVGTSITGPVISQIDALFPGFQSVYTAVLESASVMVLVSILALFPDGRFVPAWTKWVFPLLLTLAVAVQALQFINTGVRGLSDVAFLEIAPLFVTIALGLVSQIYRYVVVSGPRERQQTRGVIFSFFAFILVMVVSTLIAPNALTQAAPPTSFDLVATMVSYSFAAAAILGVIASITLGVLRYQLWDIDVLIRRTTSYAIVTGLLVLVYFGSVVVLQRVFTAVTGQTSTIAIVLSTLLIAALFLPLRQRVQTAIDRRFFRSKYDAEKTLEAFAATVRDETDLDALTAELVRVIEETMQPESVTVWLAPPESFESRPSA